MASCTLMSLLIKLSSNARRRHDFCGRKIKMDKVYTSCENKNEQLYWNNVQNKAFDPTKCSSPYLS